MLKRNSFFKDLSEIPTTMFYMLFKSSLAPILWGMIVAMLIVFGYVVITG